MNTDRKIDVDDKVIALRNPRKEPITDFEARAQVMHYQLHVADTVPTVGSVEAARYTTNHGSKLS